MDSNKINKQQISRKRFLQTLGSIIAGGTIIGASGYLLSTRNNRLKNCIGEQNNQDCSICKVKNCPLRKGVTF